MSARLLRSVFGTWLASGTSLAFGLSGFLAFQGWYDTGRIDTDLGFYFFAFPLGFTMAATIIAGEHAVVPHFHPILRGLLATTARCAGYGVIAIASGFFILALYAVLVYRTAQPVLGLAAISGVMTLFFLPMMLPFGLVSGSMMGIALWLWYRRRA
ncbi:MAG TPA: hypothetical protein PLC98_22580 [Anaerolineales bacterium]|nr:hypothetical protein [Anaerolineales bacterium]